MPSESRSTGVSGLQRLSAVPVRMPRWVVNTMVSGGLWLVCLPAIGTAQVSGGAGTSQFSGVEAAGILAGSIADGRLVGALAPLPATRRRYNPRKMSPATRLRAAASQNIPPGKPIAGRPRAAFLAGARGVQGRGSREARATGPAANGFAAGPFQGIADTGIYPPDPTIAAGPLNLIAAANGNLTVLGQNGKSLGSQTLQHFFSPLGAVTNDGLGPIAPHAIYDRYIDRFWLLALTADYNAPRTTILLALSDTNDATSTWRLYSFDGGQNGGTASGLICDSPQIGIDAQAVYLTSNQYDSAGSFQYARIRIMTKDQFVNRTSISWWDFYGLKEGSASPFAIIPAHMYGAAPADGEFLVDAHGGGGAGNAFEVWRITNPQNCCTPGNQSSPRLAQITQPVGDYDVPPNARQPGASVALVTSDTELLYAIWQNGLLSTGQNAAGSTGGAGIAFTEFDVSQFPSIATINDWLLEDPQTDYFYPAVDVSGTGDKVMVYGTSSSTRFAEADFLIIPNSSACTFCIGDSGVLASGAGAYAIDSAGQDSLWGFYFGASADPAGAGIWIHGQYAAAQANTWGTEVGLVSLPPQIIETATQTVRAAEGGTIRLPGGSTASIPPGALPGDRQATLSLVSSLGEQPPSGSIVGVGAALKLTFAPVPAGAQAALRPLSLPLQDSTQNLLVNLAYGGPPPIAINGSTTLADAVDLRGTGGNFVGIPGTFDSTRGVQSFTLPQSVAQSSEAASLSAVNYSAAFTGAVPPRFGPRIWNGSQWLEFPQGFDPSKKTLILVHGVLSTVEASFGGSENDIAQAGGYQQVIGFDYDWTRRVDDGGQKLAAFLDQLSSLKLASADIEAHSFGTVVSIDAVSMSSLNVGTMVLEGGPLEGIPFSVELYTTALAYLNGDGYTSTVQDSFKSGMMQDVQPGSEVLQRIKRNVLAKPNPPRFIKVCGTTSAGMYPKYVGDYANSLLNFEANDGLMTVTSCSGADLPGPPALLFPNAHIFLERDFNVIRAVGQLVNTNPSPSPATYTLTVVRAGTGSGAVDAVPSGFRYTGGTSVTLTATAASTSTFAGWGSSKGSCSGILPTCSFKVNADEIITATFNLKGPAVSLSTAILNFDTVNLGASASKSVTLTNSGNSPLSITSIGFGASGGGDFSETQNCPIAPNTLAPNASCTITARFTPTAAAARSATIGIIDNAPGSPHNISLAGVGFNPNGGGGALTGRWKGTWTRPAFGLCKFETSSLDWMLTQSGSSVSGTFVHVVTAIDPNGLCPDAVGDRSSGSLTQGTLTGSALTIFTEGGTPFTGTVAGTQITGTGGHVGVSGPFTLDKQ